MTSAVLINVLAAAIFVGLWTLAVVHVTRTLAKDERRAPAQPRIAQTVPRQATAPAGMERRGMSDSARPLAGTGVARGSSR